MRQRHEWARSSLLGAFFLVAGCEMMTGGNAGSTAVDSDGYVSIFNGEDLTGWVQVLDSILIRRIIELSAGLRKVPS